MAKFSIEKEWGMTQKHIGKIEKEAEMDSSLVEEVEAQKYADEMAETGSRKMISDVAKTRVGMLADISMVVDYMADGTLPLKEETLRQLLAEIDVVKSIQDGEDVILLKSVVEDLLTRVKEKL